MGKGRMDSEETVYNKLIRDKVPEIVERDGEIPVTRELNDGEFKTELERKLLEEYHEVLTASSSKERIEELADMLEVISTLSSLENSDLQSVLSVMEEKRKRRGSFSKKLFLEKIVKN